MKMSAIDFGELKKAVLEVLDENPDMEKEYAKLGLSPKRYRWDALWLSGVEVTKYYDYLNDDHIDTALRKILGS
jgi:hypothetical protein